MPWDDKEWPTKHQDNFMQMVANITDTPVPSRIRGRPLISDPKHNYFSELYEAVALNNGERYYILRPEVIESYTSLLMASDTRQALP